MAFSQLFCRRDNAAFRHQRFENHQQIQVDPM